MKHRTLLLSEFLLNKIWFITYIISNQLIRFSFDSHGKKN
jgi:hypothetical protein